jgi:hypothetical protein
VTSTDIPALLRRGALGVAAGRVALGLLALARPAVPSRPWVGAGPDDLTAQVFGRALGGRDLALGLGALAALARADAEPAAASAWVAAGALSDSLDVVASLASWSELPRIGRLLVITSAAGAALVGTAGAVAVLLPRRDTAPDRRSGRRDRWGPGHRLLLRWSWDGRPGKPGSMTHDHVTVCAAHGAVQAAPAAWPAGRAARKPRRVVSAGCGLSCRHTSECG